MIKSPQLYENPTAAPIVSVASSISLPDFSPVMETVPTVFQAPLVRLKTSLQNKKIINNLKKQNF